MPVGLSSLTFELEVSEATKLELALDIAGFPPKDKRLQNLQMCLVNIDKTNIILPTILVPYHFNSQI